MRSMRPSETWVAVDVDAAGGAFVEAAAVVVELEVEGHLPVGSGSSPWMVYISRASQL